MTLQGLHEIVNICVEDRHLDYLKEYLSSTTDASLFNAQALSCLLDDVLRRDGAVEEKRIQVSCILVYLQHFLEIEKEHKIWEQLAEQIGKVCEVIFDLLDGYVKDEYLVGKLIQITSSIMEHGEKLSDTLLKYMLTSLLTTSSSLSSLQTRLPVLSFLASLLQKSSRLTRWEVLPSSAEHLDKLSNYLISCGDYETQVSIVEIIARSWNFIKDHDDASNLFSGCPTVLQTFKRYSFLNFDPECRSFLNETNDALGDKQLVFSIPSVAIYADNTRIKKPIDPTYKEFWVDFNIRSKSVSFYYLEVSTDSWEFISVNEEHVRSIVSKNSHCQSKNGKLINTIELKFILENGVAKVDFPNILKMYFCKGRRFEKVEETAIKEIFKNKYRNEIVNFKDYEEETILLLSEVSFELKEPTELESNSYTEPRTSEQPMNKTSVTHHSIESESLDIEDLSEDSFSQHIEQRVKESSKTLETKSSIEVNSEVKKTEENLCLKTLEGITTSNGKAEKCSNFYKSNSPERNDRHSLNGFNSNPLETLGSNKTVSKLESSMRISLISQSNEDSGNVSKLQNSGERLKKRSYSSERSNQEGQIISQDDNCVEVLACKLRKKEHTIEIKEIDNGINVRVSTERNKKEIDSPQTDHSLSGVNILGKQLLDIEEKNAKPSKQKRTLTSLSSPYGQPHYFISETKKLLALNKTPENAKELFPPSTVYSILSTAGKSKRVGKTYGRGKPKSKRRKVAQIESSNSDSDYVPENKVQDQRVRRKIRKPDSETFVSIVTKNTVDSIRDIKPTKEKKLMSFNLEDSDIIKARDLDFEISAVDMELEDKIYDIIDDGKNKGKQTKGKGRSLKGNEKKKYQGQLKKESINKNVETVTYHGMDCNLEFEPTEFDDVFGDNDFIGDVFNNPLPKDKSLMQTSFKMNEIVQFGKFCVTQVNNEIKRIKSLASKEREMNFATFEFKAQTSCNAMYSQCQKMEMITKNLLKVKTLLDTTYYLQEDVASQFKTEITQIEEAKQILIKSINKIGKSETSQIATIFQKMGKCIKNIIFAFIQRNTNKSTFPHNSSK